jgi:ribose transport system ATP-binding protein
MDNPVTSRVTVRSGSSTVTIAPFLRLHGIGKCYAAPVLQDVDLDLMPGEVHALMGANGAGKSTLARIISGLVRPDAGSMTLQASPYRPAGKAVAESFGVQIVQQEPTLIPTLSVAENLFLSCLPSRWGWIRRGELHHRARHALSAVGLDQLDPMMATSRLGVGEQQLVELARALACSCRLLILDEPTAAVFNPQVERLFQHVARLRAAGVAIIYISHRLDEIRRIADRITVLRDGRLVATRPAAELDLDEAVRLMVGPNAESELQAGAIAAGPLLLRVERLRRGEWVREVSFELRTGEILGVSGLVGSGRSELLRAVFGADRADSGALYLGDSEQPRRFVNPREAIRAGVGMVPEDRKSQGLLPQLPIRVNLTLASMQQMAGPLGWVNRRTEYEAVESVARQVRLRCDSLDQPVRQLSGGNQQKVLLGRWLMRAPQVMLLDEPTRGIDIAAKFVVYDLIRDLAARGAGIVVASSELEELMLLCDRIAVLSAGRLVQIFSRGEWSRERLLAAAFQRYSSSSSAPGEGAG